MNLLRKAKYVLEKPSLIKYKAKGIHPIHAYNCLIAQDLIPEKQFKSIFDIGANIGLFAKAATTINPNAKVHSFEPIPELHNQLDKIPNIIPYKIALGNNNQKTIFNHDKDWHSTSSMLEYDSQHKRSQSNSIQKIEVLQKRFEDLNIPIDRPSYVKMDVQGAEKFVLEGFSSKLNEIDVVQLVLMFDSHFKNQSKLSEIMPFIEKAGFKGFIQRIESKNTSTVNACSLFFFRDSQQKRRFPI